MSLTTLAPHSIDLSAEEEEYCLTISFRTVPRSSHCERCTCADNDDCPCYRECDHYLGSRDDLENELDQIVAEMKSRRPRQLPLPLSVEVIMEEQEPEEAEDSGEKKEPEQKPCESKDPEPEEKEKEQKPCKSHKSKAAKDPEPEVSEEDPEGEEPEDIPKPKSRKSKAVKGVSKTYQKFLFHSIRETFSREQLLELLEQIHEEQPITSHLEQALEEHAPCPGLEVRLPQGTVYLPLELPEQRLLWKQLGQSGSLTLDGDQLHEGGPMTLSRCNIIKHKDLNPDLFKQGHPELNQRVRQAITDIILDQQETILFDS